MGANIVIAVNLNHDALGKGAIIHDHGSTVREDIPDKTEDPKLKNRKGKGAALHLLHRQFFGEQDSAPGISRVMMDSFNIVQDRIARSRLAGDPPDIFITPQLTDVGLFDFHKADIAIPEGEKATRKILKDLDYVMKVMDA